MIVIICAKHKKNPSRTADASERTRFSMSRPNDLEDIGQGQGSSHATHPLMLLIICTKYGKNPSWTVDSTGRTRNVNWQTDRHGESNIPPPPPPPPPPHTHTNFAGGWWWWYNKWPGHIQAPIQFHYFIVHIYIFPYFFNTPHQGSMHA